MARFSLYLGAVVLAGSMSAAGAGQHDAELPGALLDRIRAIPPVDRFEYTLSAAIRPFPLIWIRRDEVGSARFVRRAGADGARGYELLVGSEPARAPRRINRWGYLAEEVRAGGGSMIGVIKQSDEQTLGQAREAVKRDAAAREFRFKVYAGSFGEGVARMGDAVVNAPQDFTVGGSDALLQLVAPAAVKVRSSAIVSGMRIGIISTLAELLRDTSRAWLAKRQERDRRHLDCFFNNSRYQLTVESTKREATVKIGSTVYREVLRSELEGRQPGTNKRMRFEVWYQPSGPLAEVPLRVLVQPRWWFRFELTLAR
jgi:hypothetical protein